MPVAAAAAAVPYEDVLPDFEGLLDEDGLPGVIGCGSAVRIGLAFPL
jgi:hypothetical protein